MGIVEAGDVFAESFALAGEPLEVSVFSPGEAEVLFLDAEAAGVYSGRFTVNLLALMAGKNLALTRKEWAIWPARPAGKTPELSLRPGNPGRRCVV
ncbi:MAG: hypothetical protein V8R40_06130 [Dysosmobacter sp.]